MRPTSPSLRFACACAPAVAAVLFALAATRASAETIALTPARDNTIYEEADDLSNGGGGYVFVGRTRVGPARRALLAFDIAAGLPAGAFIESATLRLHLSRSDLAGTTEVSMHRVLADWGEGESHAPGEEGTGDLAAPGDATWSDRFFGALPAMRWTSAGGDFATGPSATATVASTPGTYVWSSPALAADVQAWLERPEEDFGWIVVGDETTLPTAKRFDSGDSAIAANRPVLEVVFTPAAGGVCGDGVIGADEACDDGDASWTRGEACNAACGLLACGDPDDSAGASTATDALFTLQASVGSQVCEPCLCDVDDSGTVSAVDALVLLQRATGQPLILSCPPCP